MDEKRSKALASRIFPKERRRLGWALLASLFLHFVVGPLLAWLFILFTLRLLHPNRPPELARSSTAITIEQRTLQRLQNQPLHHAAAAKSATPTQPTSVQAPPPRHELTRARPQAPTQAAPTHARPSFGQQLAKQQQQFAEEVHRLHQENNPLAIGTSAPNPASYRHTDIDASGTYTQMERDYAWLRPVRHWFSGGMSCYYTTYEMSSSFGGTEDGTIPWPICYPRNDDRMLPLDRSHELPVPVPPPGFTLAKGTYLTPFLQKIFDRR
jgi:hypothetical protein